MKKALIILIVFTVTQYSIAQHTNYKYGDTLKIFALSGLKLRSEGNLKSKVLGSMKFGEKVIILDTTQYNSKNAQIIEGFSGQWIKVKYDTIEGYTFDGFLSSLPVPKTNTKKINAKMYAGGAQNDYNERSRIIWALTEYIDTEFYPIGKPVIKDNGIDGEQYSSSKSQKLSRGFTKVESGGWESGGLSIEMPNIRLSEIKNLVLILVTKCGFSNASIEKVKDNISKIKMNSKDAQNIFDITDFHFYIYKRPTKNNNPIWAIGYDEVGS